MSNDFKDIEEVLDILPEDSEIKDLTEVQENDIVCLLYTSDAADVYSV